MFLFHGCMLEIMYCVWNLFSTPLSTWCILWYLVAFLTSLMAPSSAKFLEEAYWNGLAGSPWRLQCVLGDWGNLMTLCPMPSNLAAALEGHGPGLTYFLQQRPAQGQDTWDCAGRWGLTAQAERGTEDSPLPG